VACWWALHGGATRGASGRLNTKQLTLQSHRIRWVQEERRAEQLCPDHKAVGGTDAWDSIVSPAGRGREGMEQRLTLVALGVRDLDVALRFYRDGLGWRLWSGSGGDFGLFVLKGGVGLALYPRHRLAADAGVPDAEGFGGVTIAQNVATREDVDRQLAAAVAAGGILLKAASEKPWGYTGYFADPDGHPWEVAYVPSLSLRDGMLNLE
jgi:uncharacterized protein